MFLCPNSHSILPCEEKSKTDPAEELQRAYSFPIQQHSEADFIPDFRDVVSRLTHAEAVRNNTSNSSGKHYDNESVIESRRE